MAKKTIEELAEEKRLADEAAALAAEEDEDDDSQNEDDDLEAVAQAKAEMKALLDRAYASRDKAQTEAAKLRAEVKAAERQRLQDAGKTQELAALAQKDLEEENASLREQVTKLTRDRVVDDALSNLPFRNERARSSGRSTIVSEMVQDEDGNWSHRSGASIKDFVKVFHNDPDNEFLFSPKENTGAATGNKGKGASASAPKSLVGLTTQELLDLAKHGKLGQAGF